MCIVEESDENISMETSQYYLQMKLPDVYNI